MTRAIHQDFIDSHITRVIDSTPVFGLMYKQLIKKKKKISLNIINVCSGLFYVFNFVAAFAATHWCHLILCNVH